MCSTIFSIAANYKPWLRENNRNLLLYPTFKSATRSITTIPKQSEISIVPQLSIQISPHVDVRIQQLIERQCRHNTSFSPHQNAGKKLKVSPLFVEESYKRCKQICRESSTSYYLASLLLTKERQRAIWAIYVWAARIDEIVDGANAEYMSSSVVDRWEERLEDIFNGNPYDILDVALADTLFNFPLDIKVFKDMVEGMRMDTYKCRYRNFEELYLYCYYVAGTLALMCVPIMGIAPDSCASAQCIYNGALSCAIGNQLTNILRDVGEDAMRGRIYLPQDELAQFGLSDKDVLARKVSDRWREFMKEQITRARYYFNLAEKGASQLHKASRWPVWSSLMLYKEILDAIEDNDYDNLTKKAYVGKTKKLLTLPLAYCKSQSSPSLILS